MQKLVQLFIFFVLKFPSGKKDMNVCLCGGGGGLGVGLGYDFAGMRYLNLLF